ITPAFPGRPILVAWRQSPVEWEDLGGGCEPPQLLDDPVDLPGAGDEDEGVAATVMVAGRGPCDVVEELTRDTSRVGPRQRRRLPGDRERVERTLAVDDRGVIEHSGDAGG